jgi:hypothetical protein
MNVRLCEQIEFGCHGLAPWSFTLNAFSNWRLSLSWKREPPRRKAVASASTSDVSCSRERESPRRKAVASGY